MYPLFENRRCFEFVALCSSLVDKKLCRFDLDWAGSTGLADSVNLVDFIEVVDFKN
jgi:hypothetical protein